MLPELTSKVALDAIACATQLEGLVIIEMKGKVATHDVHVFSVNPTWSKNLCVCGEAGVVAKGKDSKTGNRGYNEVHRLC